MKIEININLPKRNVTRYNEHCHQIVALVLMRFVIKEHAWNRLVCSLHGFFFFLTRYLRFHVLRHFVANGFVFAHLVYTGLHYLQTRSALR